MTRTGISTNRKLQSPTKFNLLMKKILILISLFFLFLNTPNANAKEATTPAVMQKIQIRQDIKNEIKTEVKEKINLLKKIYLEGTISSISTSSFDLKITTGDLSGKTITVNLNPTAKIVRKFGGISSLAEYQINDEIQVAGKWSDDTKTSLNANLLRNKSIQKRYGTFFGTLKSLGENTFVFESVKRGDQTVTITSSTKIVNRKMQTLAFSDLKAGQRIRVKGLWNNKNNTITDVSQIKNFSLPEKITLTPSATPTP